MLCEQKPMTIRGFAARLGDRRTERASAILERLTANGTLARFRAGLSEYYAVPKEALTGDGPGKGTIIADSVRNILLEYAITLGWALTGAISMALSFGILLKVYDWMTPVDEWEEIKKGNISIAILMGCVIISFAIVIANIIAPK